jgi:putative Mg2+ transporter-C (MgtC) family protein
MELGGFERFFASGPLLDGMIPIGTAVLCGLALGAEREVNRHAAGLRTLGLIALGACLFTMAGRWLVDFPLSGVGDEQVVDPGRLASYVIAGVGFLGAGPIITRTASTEGLTTAASIWSTAAIGVLAGFGHVQVAIASTALILLVLWGLRSLAARLRGDPHRHGDVHLVVDDHLALTRVHLLLEQNPLVKQRRVEDQGGVWHVQVSYCGDEVLVNNVLESLASIPGVRGAHPDEHGMEGAASISSMAR